MARAGIAGVALAIFLLTPAATVAGAADPLFAERATLVDGGGAPFDEAGTAVAVDGDLAVVGIPRHDGVAGGDQGAVAVFRRTVAGWSQVALLTSAGSTSAEQLGAAVDVDATSGVIVAGARFADRVEADNDNTGAVVVWLRQPDGTFAEDDRLVAADGAGTDQLGTSVAVSGLTVVAGAVFADVTPPPPTIPPLPPPIGPNPPTGDNRGAAYVFVRTAGAPAGTWSQQAKLVRDPATAADFDDVGASVAVDGDEVVVGAVFADVSTSSPGAAIPFRRTGTTWTREPELVDPTAESGQSSGSAVAVAGPVALVASPQKSSTPGGGDLAGAVRVFRRAGGSPSGAWAAAEELREPAPVGTDQFGSSVALGTDVGAIGARFADGPGDNQGAVYAYDLRAGSFAAPSRLLASGGASADQLGDSVGAGTGTVVGGARFADGPAGSNQGDATLWETPTPAPVVPEVPWPALLGACFIAVCGGFWWRTRRVAGPASAR